MIEFVVKIFHKGLLTLQSSQMVVLGLTFYEEFFASFTIQTHACCTSFHAKRKERSIPPTCRRKAFGFPVISAYRTK